MVALKRHVRLVRVAPAASAVTLRGRGSVGRMEGGKGERGSGLGFYIEVDLAVGLAVVGAVRNVGLARKM